MSALISGLTAGSISSADGAPGTEPRSDGEAYGSADPGPDIHADPGALRSAYAEADRRRASQRTESRTLPLGLSLEGSLQDPCWPENLLGMQVRSA